MANVGRSGYVIAKLNLKVRNAPPRYVKPVHSISRKPTVVYGNSFVWDVYDKWLGTRPCGTLFIMRGPSGVGKTHTTLLFAKNMKYSVMEFNSSSGESASEFATRLHEVSLAGRVEGRRRLILVDELDSLPVDVQGVILAHVKSMTARFAPLVCTCNDFASATVREIAGLAQHSVALRALAREELAKYAAHYYPTRLSRTVETAVVCANGDIRQLDMRLRVSDASKPDPLCNVFELGRSLITRRFPSRWLADASTNTDSRMVLYMAHENYTSAVPSLESMADAADLYSVAECMQSFAVIGALDEVVAVLGASGPSVGVDALSSSVWKMRADSKIRWPELLRARKSIVNSDARMSRPA
jgi:hypothetical protein